MTKINRAGRGDGLYLLRYYPRRFLYAKSDGGVYDEGYGSNLPNPSFPFSENKCEP